MRRQLLLAQLLNSDHPTQTERYRVPYRRRFEDLESRHVLSANGVDIGLEVEVVTPATLEADLVDHAPDTAASVPGCPDDNCVWDDTDILHLRHGVGHDAVLANLEFDEECTDACPELLQALARADYLSKDPGENGFFDVFTEFAGANGDSIIDIGDLPMGVTAGDSIIDIGDLPMGVTAGDSIIDIGDLPDGLARSIWINRGIPH